MTSKKGKMLEPASRSSAASDETPKEIRLSSSVLRNLPILSPALIAHESLFEAYVSDELASRESLLYQVILSLAL
jgi:hypothetical protein